MRRKTVLSLVAAAVGTAGVVLPVTSSSAHPPAPTLRLVAVTHSGTLYRYGGESRHPTASLNLGVYLAAVNGPVEFIAHRHGVVAQVRRSNGRVEVIRKLPKDSATNFMQGLGHFLKLSWVDPQGNVVVQQRVPWCPTDSPYQGGRLNTSGPLLPKFPSYCSGSRMTQGMVWGVDEGWAAPLFPNGLPDPGVVDGRYTLEISVAQPWRSVLHMTGPASVSAQVTVHSSRCGGGCCGGGCCGGRCVAGARRMQPLSATGSTVSRPPTSAPGPAPDLNPFPPHHIKLQINRRTGQQVLSFASTVWDGGRGPLLVEGFRSGPRRIMRAVQFFLTHGHVVGTRDIGELHFDTRRGHHHWHFEDFARYDLFSPATGHDVRSQKQSFCIAPTDAIDLTLPNADLQPDETGLSSACGYDDPTAIWMRETLPVGWGDTYYQSVAGQAFDVTNLPNGVYRLRVTANPSHHLVETNYRNDTAYRRIRLSGSGTSRKLTVLRGT